MNVSILHLMFSIASETGLNQRCDLINCLLLPSFFIAFADKSSGKGEF